MSDAEIDVLASQVNRELKELSAEPEHGFQKSASGRKIVILPKKQQLVIEKAIGQPAAGFWEKYKRAARKDLCQADGLLYKQWHKWRDLQTKDAVKVSLGIVAGLGISGPALPLVGVAAAVILLNVVLNIGINVICEDDEEKGHAGGKKPRARPPVS